MTTTTNYGTWYNHTGYNTSPEGDIQDAINGGDTDWRERMDAAGKLDDIATDYRNAVQTALPDGIWLTGDEFIGPHHSDPAYSDEIAEFDIKAAIKDIDLNGIIERHDVDNADTEAPQVTTTDVRTLLGSTAEEPVLYLKLDDDSGNAEELDVWAQALVPSGTIVITRVDALDLFGDEPDDETIAEYLPQVQESVDSLVADLT